MKRNETENMSELCCTQECECDELHTCQLCYEQDRQSELQEQFVEILNFLREEHGT